MYKLIVYFFALLLTLSSCVEVSRPYSELPPGIWRAELQITEDEVLPFNFDITYDEQQVMAFTIHNAEERITIKDIAFGRNRKLQDTVEIRFTLMDSYIKAIYKETVIQGYWYAPNRGEGYRIPFVATHGQAHRFTTDKDLAKADLSGKWAATFELETEDEYPAVAELQQDGTDLTGTFLTETGDYRYLEGTVQSDQFMLSCFDGAHAFLFTAKLQGNDALTGNFYNGKHYKTSWVAQRDDNATLTDPYHLTQVTTRDKKINFSLPNIDGDIISLDNEFYKGKPKLITIMGTWCPNCLDESKFIIDYLKNNDVKDLEVIAIAFEKYKDADQALAMIGRYKKRLKIPYEMVYGGYYDKGGATASLGFLDEIISYPTLLYVDRNNKVRRVHTGYAGPATSQFSAFKTSFDIAVKELIE